MSALGWSDYLKLYILTNKIVEPFYVHIMPFYISQLPASGSSSFCLVKWMTVLNGGWVLVIVGIVGSDSIWQFETCQCMSYHIQTMHRSSVYTRVLFRKLLKSSSQWLLSQQHVYYRSIHIYIHIYRNHFTLNLVSNFLQFEKWRWGSREVHALSRFRLWSTTYITKCTVWVARLEAKQIILESVNYRPNTDFPRLINYMYLQCQ